MAGPRKTSLNRINFALSLLCAALCVATVAFYRGSADSDGPLDRRIAEIQLNNVALMDAAAYLAHAYRVQIHVNWEAIQAAGTFPSTPVTLHLRDVTLEAALEETLGVTSSDLAFELRGDVIEITTQSALPRNVKVYDLGYVLPPQRPIPLNPTGESNADNMSPGRAEVSDRLCGLLKETVTSQAWVFNGVRKGAVWRGPERLIVCHSREGHRNVAALLRHIREADACQSWEQAASSPRRPGGESTSGGASIDSIFDSRNGIAPAIVYNVKDLIDQRIEAGTARNAVDGGDDAPPIPTTRAEAGDALAKDIGGASYFAGMLVARAAPQWRQEKVRRLHEMRKTKGKTPASPPSNGRAGGAP